MEIGLHAHMVDSTTDKIGDALRSVFKILCDKLNGDYGGIIEHLWIDFELIENHAKPDGKPRFPFRFSKRVSGVRVLVRYDFQIIIMSDILAYDQILPT